MTFREAIKKTPHLSSAWKPGLQALRAQDKTPIKPENTRHLSGSADVDTALQQVEPQANRWDFAIGYQHSNRKDEFIYWVETHTGSDDQIKVVLKKLDWLKRWLRKEGHNLSQSQFDQAYYWVPSGPTFFTKGSAQVKILAQQGVLYSGSVLKIHDVRPS